ncbi:MAG TPA: GNAT family N-acetyltransferase [Streptosporangiaceae bacterium]|nr:GNAT family N-acetyltransferase [Streptosporangiaceae bacterium]
MEIAVVRPDELGAGEVAAWHAMQDQGEEIRNPFLSPEFAQAAGQLVPSARVAVVEEGGQPAGFFAFEVGRLGSARPVGAWLSDCQGLVHAPEFQPDAGELLRGCGISAWQFDHLVSWQQPFSKYQVASARSPVIDLAEGAEVYAARLKAHSPGGNDLGRKSRKIERELGPLKFVIDSSDTGDLRTLMGWKSEQYRRTGRNDRFDEPWIVELISKLFSHRPADEAGGYPGSPGGGPGGSPGGSLGGFCGLLSMLYAGDTPVAGHFGLAYGGVLAHWFPAYDARYSKYSPGLIQLLEMTRQAPDLGISSIDLGKGAARYKEKMKSYDLTVAEGTAIGRPLLGNALRVRHAPARWAAREIRDNQRVFGAADRMLKRYGQMKVARQKRAGSVSESGPASDRP